MNVEVNGTMEKPMETSLGSQTDTHSDPQINVAPKPDDNELPTKHCDSSSGTNNGNHSSIESNKNPEAGGKGNLLGDKVTEDNDVETDGTEKSVSHEEKILQDINCNSNGSHQDSTGSPKTVLDRDQQSSVINLNADEVNTSDEELESGGDIISDDEYGSELSEKQVKDIVTLDSDLNSSDSQESHENLDDSDIVVLDNDITQRQNGDSEIHEILSDNETDDCIVTESVTITKKTNSKSQTSRSSRSVKRKSEESLGNCEESSDIELVPIEDPLTEIFKNVVKEKLPTQNKSKDHKEPSVVYVDTNSILGGKAPKGLSITKTNSSPSSQYQNAVPRGTTITTVPSKPTPVPTPAPILPSLTDDMFVVEAPSFIVPYVYEKPSLEPFREFVDKLGKEIEDQIAKEKKLKLEQEKKEKEKKMLERKERKERGEEVSESEAEPDAEDEKKKQKAEKKERRRRGVEDDDDSWDGSESDSDDEETISDAENKTEIIKAKEDTIAQIKNVMSDLTAEKIITEKSDNYFDCSLGKFFINIGVNLVQEYVQTDLLKLQSRKLYKEKKNGHSTKATQSTINSLMKNLDYSKENNAPFKIKMKKCEFCTFKTESDLVMSHHLETPHMKNNMYKCNFCPYEIRSHYDMLFHMEAVHNVRGRLEKAPSHHQCPNCPFEDNGKGKLARHQGSCVKKFKVDTNMAPPVDWEPPAKIPKIVKPRNNQISGYQAAFKSGVAASARGTPILGVPGIMGGIKGRPRPPMSMPQRLPSQNLRTPLLRPNAPLVFPTYQNNAKIAPVGKQPSLSITALPRATLPPPNQSLAQASQHSKGTFVICEICDGYIKDLEQLRNHMQWIHKVKIHPKMIYNRPPLNCQKCQFRFFTDQGLERHLLGSHGLVTSSMQEAANKGKDAGRCPVCGRVYQWKLLNHVARDHDLTLKPAHLSYKCTVCTATFGMYKQFESHVYSAHRVVAKRVMDKGKAAPPTKTATNEAKLKPLKINDEITIIPQPAKSTATSSKGK